MLKPILPSSKEGKRYIMYESRENISDSYLKDAIKSFIGELGFARAGIRLMSNNIIQVNSNYVDEVIYALALTKDIKTKRTSGMINKLKKEAN